ncbi:hypothetical protein LR002_03070 [Candidatus Gracilibacteria bacterium]|nr:hypothetical protein [Candidatus Gracilibacteria bacterium]
MNKSKKFAELLFNSSLDAEVKDFIIENLDKFSDAEKNEMFEILEKDMKNTKNILNLTKMKFDLEQKRFEKESNELELEVLKAEMEKNGK